MVATTAHPQLDGNCCIVPRPEEFAGRVSSKAAELLLAVVLILLLPFPGTDAFALGPGFFCVVLAFALPIEFPNAEGEAVRRIVPCIICGYKGSFCKKGLVVVVCNFPAARCYQPENVTSEWDWLSYHERRQCHCQG